MRILIEGRNYENYLAKCHEAFRTGLRAVSDARSYGKGYPGYWPFTFSYAQIIERLFPDEPPDILIAQSCYPHKKRGFQYHGISKIDALKSFILGDYWDVSIGRSKQFAEFVLKNKVDFILTYFLQPLDIWADTAIADRFLFLPPSYDPALFNDWQTRKTYDVGFLAAGTAEYTAFYPERYAIHQQLLKKRGINYLWAQHPGWRIHSQKSPLVGRNFSKAINSCRMFITTGGRYRNAHAKYIEILASKTLLLAEEPYGWEKLGLQDGENYVRITQYDIMDKIDYYLSHEEEVERIARNGFELAQRKHNCRQRAMDFIDMVSGATNNR